MRAYFAETRAPLTAAALALPLLCIYGVGSLLVPEARNGADVLTAGLAAAFSAAGWQGWRPWAGFYGALLAINVGLVVHLSRRARVSWRMLPPLLLECMVYAVATGTIADWMTGQALDVLRPHLALWPLAQGAGTGAAAGASDLPGGTASAVPAAVPTVTAVIISAGAGLHEELIFRLVGIGMIARGWLGEAWRRRTGGVLALALVSSLAFAGVHHLVEPFSWSALIFRSVAGLVFATLYLARGFAVAAWTHALYDVWILVFLSR